MPRKKTPTIYDVAERSGISISTVSRVLNNPEKVNPKTRARVLDAIDKLGFVPKAEARARALSQTNRIGVITPFFTAPSFVQRLRGVASALAAFNYELVIYTVDSFDRLEGYLSSIPFTGNLDGLIVMSLPIQKKEARRLIEHGIETVLIEFSHPGLNCIEIDDVHGGLLAGEYLLNKGHRRIAFAGDREPHDFQLHPAGMRLKGFQQALKNAGVTIPSEYVSLFENTQEEAMRAARELLSLPQPPTAIFAAADIQALSVLKVAREMGVRVPEELAVIGFDDIDSAEFMDLTTIRQHLDESGKLAVDILLAHIADPLRPPQHVKLPLSLIERQTT
jgi:DNA-binding LacI/PurR family transcriptional regulator